MILFVKGRLYKRHPIMCKRGYQSISNVSKSLLFISKWQMVFNICVRHRSLMSFSAVQGYKAKFVYPVHLRDRHAKVYLVGNMITILLHLQGSLTGIYL